ncbi:hypothetical protein J0910_30765 [Nocardiopsis sp. CNT-189]|uniref:hypothetical protein n=1 Tax=Nocardiopsis oceanisediminis TaxID=2816862 RepID=UPI003B2A1FDD
MDTLPRPLRYPSDPPQECLAWPAAADGSRPRGALPCARPAGHRGEHESVTGDRWAPQPAPAAAPPAEAGGLFRPTGWQSPAPGRR